MQMVNYPHLRKSDVPYIPYIAPVLNVFVQAYRMSWEVQIMGQHLKC